MSMPNSAFQLSSAARQWSPTSL